MTAAEGACSHLRAAAVCGQVAQFHTSNASSQRARRNYELFYSLPEGSVSLQQVSSSAAGTSGWASANIVPFLQGEGPAAPPSSQSSAGHRVQSAKEAAAEKFRCKRPQQFYGTPNSDERRVDPELGGSVVTYAQMCSGHADQNLRCGQFQLQCHWQNMRPAEDAGQMPSPCVTPPYQDLEPILEPAAKRPIDVLVNSLGGELVKVQADPDELVAYLRRRIAKAMNKPPCQLVLARDSMLLEGTQFVGDMLGEVDHVEVSVFTSHEGGPADEWMNLDNPQELAEYMPDLYAKLKCQEAKILIRPTYMDQQKDINSKMRALLVDWLVDVHSKSRLRTETLFLTVILLDRYLQANLNVPRKRLQLVGSVALLIASKFEDTTPCEGSFLAYHSDGAFTTKDVCNMEAHMLVCLGFDLCTPTASHFWDLYQRANRCEEHHCFVGQYLMELSLLEMWTVGEAPSKLAAAATLLSNKLLHREVCWPAAMSSYTGYSEEGLQDLAHKMRQVLESANVASLQAVFRKFGSSRLGSVALNLP